MRSFIIASVILSVICVMIGLNTVYVTARTDELLSICETLKNDSSPHQIDSLLSKWESCRDIIALSIHRSDLENAESAIIALREYIDSPNDFNYHLAKLAEAIKHISDQQKFTVDSIF